MKICILKPAVIILLLLTVTGKNLLAQEKDSLFINMNKFVFNPGDTLNIVAQYKPAEKKNRPATLQMVIEDEMGKNVKMRWPVLNGEIDGDIALPDSLAKGKYTISFAIQPRFFSVFGKVNEPIKTTSLNVMMLTAKGEIVTDSIPLQTDGSFIIRNWLFEKDATFMFSRPKKNRGDLDIKVETLLDSTYEPAALAIREFYIGTPPSATLLDSTGKIRIADTSLFSDRANKLLDVVVKGKQKTPAEKFNEQYSSGLFKSMNERVFDFMNDPFAGNAISVLSFLQGRVAGLMIERNGGQETARWRDAGVTFYIDEMRVEAEQVASISTTDIAIVKVYPPPFFGNSGGNGGAIAIYTRRGGGEYGPKTDRHIFRIKGYTPLETALSFRQEFPKSKQ